MLGLETKGPSKSVSGWHATTFQFGWDHLAMLLEETHGALLSLGGGRLCSRSTNTTNSGELHGVRSMPPESPDRQPGMANIDTQAAPLVRLPDTQGSLAPSCRTCSPAGPPPLRRPSSLDLLRRLEPQLPASQIPRPAAGLAVSVVRAILAPSFWLGIYLSTTIMFQAHTGLSGYLTSGYIHNSSFASPSRCSALEDDSQMSPTLPQPSGRVRVALDLLPSACCPRLAALGLLPSACCPRLAALGLLPSACCPRLAFLPFSDQRLTQLANTVSIALGAAVAPRGAAG